jgi:hypothetical protein
MRGKHFICGCRYLPFGDLLMLLGGSKQKGDTYRPISCFGGAVVYDCFGLYYHLQSWYHLLIIVAHYSHLQAGLFGVVLQRQHIQRTYIRFLF